MTANTSMPLTFPYFCPLQVISECIVTTSAVVAPASFFFILPFSTFSCFFPSLSFPPRVCVYVFVGAQLKFVLDDSSAATGISAVVWDAKRRPSDKGKGMLLPKEGIPDVGGKVSAHCRKVVLPLYRPNRHCRHKALPLCCSVLLSASVNFRGL